METVSREKCGEKERSICVIGLPKKEDIVHFDVENRFYKEILEAWFELSH